MNIITNQENVVRSIQAETKRWLSAVWCWSVSAYGMTLASRVGFVSRCLAVCVWKRTALPGIVDNPRKVHIFIDKSAQGYDFPGQLLAGQPIRKEECV